ncbi:MAG: cobyrinate a,c-diamide synthase [Lachnospiraceae bacterium]|nr:cobyrinate a,c-diamide synthase [Lachnospiraceae bacterium]
MMPASFLISAPASGSGKTVVTMALLSLLKRHGYAPAAFKAGPDYIDPAYHRAVLGLSSHNLDIFLSTKEEAAGVFSRYGEGRGSAVVEGAMGFYDGVTGAGTRASAYELAKSLSLPVLLVVDAKGAAYSLVAQIKGMKDFRPDSGITMVLLNRCSEKAYSNIAPVIFSETNVLPVGYLPVTDEAAFPSRHLGLIGADEIADLAGKVEALTDIAEKTVSLDAILQAVGKKEGSEAAENRGRSAVLNNASKTAFASAVSNNSVDNAVFSSGPRIAVARDRAFSFIYEENLDILKDMGAELVFFSPIGNEHLPADISGLYLPGGYPELFAKELSENFTMKEEVLEAIGGGLPTIAECGGYSYLQKFLEGADGNLYPMAGVFGGTVRKQKGLVRFGYAEMEAGTDSLLFSTGDTIHVHSFHHYDVDEGNCGSAFTLTKADGRTWQEGYVSPTFYCAYPHFYFPGCKYVAERFMKAAEVYRLG